MISEASVAAGVAETVARTAGPRQATKLDESLKRSAEGLRLANNVWFFNAEKDPNYAPAWTKRRRL